MQRTWVASIVALTAALGGGLIHAQERQTAQVESQDQSELQLRSQFERQLPNLGAGDIVRIARGFLITPVRLNLRDKNLALVGLGSYLVNAAGGCNDCHTSPPFAAGGDPFAGEPKKVNASAFLAGGTPFGPVVSRNLTPDTKSLLPAGLTYEQFSDSMRNGTDTKKAHPALSPLLQVMPWPVYQTLAERDLRAIYEYLSAIPHANTPAPATSAAPTTGSATAAPAVSSNSSVNP